MKEVTLPEKIKKEEMDSVINSNVLAAFYLASKYNELIDYLSQKEEQERKGK